MIHMNHRTGSSIPGPSPAGKHQISNLEGLSTRIRGRSSSWIGNCVRKQACRTRDDEEIDTPTAFVPDPGELRCDSHTGLPHRASSGAAGTLTTGTAVLLGVGLLLPGVPGVYGAQPDAEQAFHIPDPLLGEYIRTALDSNPSILTELARYRAALQKVPQQTALPDPMVSFGRYLRSVETREGPQLSTLTLSQRFPWFGKLDLKGKIAFKRAAARYRLYRAREREVAADVKRNFYDVAFLDRALEIVQEEQSLLDHYENLAQARYASGKGHQQEVIRIQAEISRTMSRLELLGQQRQSAAARLNSLLDQPPEKPVPRLLLPAAAKVSINLDELYELGKLHRQELKGTMARIEASEQGVELAKKSFWPDFTLSAGTVNVGGLPPQDLLPATRPGGGKNAYNLSVGINIPLQRHKYRAEVMEAAENLIAERSTYRDLRNRIQLSIRDLGGSHPDPVETDGPV